MHLFRIIRITLAMLAFSLFAWLNPAANAAQPHETPAGVVSTPEGSEGHSEIVKSGIIAKVEQGIAPMIVAVVVFSLVLAILSVAVWPKISAGLADREKKIRDEIESAEMARQQAKDALEQYQKSLADARIEAQKMLEQARVQQVALAGELKVKADADLAELRERARKDIEAAKRAAVAEIYSQAANIATMVASKILKRSVTAEDTGRLVEESVSQLETTRS